MTLTRWVGAIAGLLIVLGGPPVRAQSSAEAFFHEAAQQYVAGNVAAARQTVKRGLAVAPSNPRLLALRKTLEQRGAGQGGRPSSSGRQGQPSDGRTEGRRKRRTRSGTTRGGARGRSEGVRSSDQSSWQSESSREDGRGPSSRQSGRSRRAGRKQSTSRAQGAVPRRREGQGRAGRGRSGNALSRGQAKRLLRALRNQEETLLREIQIRTLEKETVEKEW